MAGDKLAVICLVSAVRRCREAAEDLWRNRFRHGSIDGFMEAMIEIEHAHSAYQEKTWKIGDVAVWHGTERQIRGIHADVAWITEPNGGNHMTVHIAELSHPDGVPSGITE